VSGETPKRQLAEILAAYERGDIDVSGQRTKCSLRAWNSPRGDGLHAPCADASRRIYQQRVGRVTRRHPGKESGIVVDFVIRRPSTTTRHHPALVARPRLLPRRRDRRRAGDAAAAAQVRVERRVIPVVAENRGGSRSSSASCGGSAVGAPSTTAADPVGCARGVRG